MAGLNLSPHQVSVNPETNLPVITSTDPYIRVSGEGHPPLYLQRGRVFSDAGDVVPEKSWPHWLLPNILLLTPAAQAEVGFVDFVQNLNTSAEEKPVAQTPKAPLKAK